MDLKARIKAFALGASVAVHFLILTWLTVEFVSVYEEYVIPEPQVIEIGEQEVALPELNDAGLPDEEKSDTKLPPAGDVEPQEDESLKPKEDIPEQMLQDPEEPPPEEITDNSVEGLPGEPNKQDPTEGMIEDPKDAEDGPDRDGVPELFGQPLEGSTLFLLDTSGSMNTEYGDTTRLEALKQEMINAINLMTPEDEFDIIIYNGDLPSWNDYCQYLWEIPMAGIEENKKDAIAWIEKLKADGTTPTREAFKHVCYIYTTEIDNFVLVTDGYPDGHTVYDIIDKAPKWFGQLGEDCKMICISIGGAGEGFIRRLAGILGGAYTLVE